MIIRKVTGLAAVALVLSLATVAWAANVKYTAELIAQRGDELATGRALWQTRGSTATFTVVVDDVMSTDLATVWVDGRFIGEFDIVDGSGAMIITNQQESAVFPGVQPGSKIVIYAGDTDRPILYGSFRTN